jgi:hypothetical protein
VNLQTLLSFSFPFLSRAGPSSSPFSFSPFPPGSPAHGLFPFSLSFPHCVAHLLTPAQSARVSLSLPLSPFPRWRVAPTRRGRPRPRARLGLEAGSDAAPPAALRLGSARPGIPAAPYKSRPNPRGFPPSRSRLAPLNSSCHAGRRRHCRPRLGPSPHRHSTAARRRTTTPRAPRGVEDARSPSFSLSPASPMAARHAPKIAAAGRRLSLSTP